MPSACSAIASSPTETCSPVEAIMSSSRCSSGVVLAGESSFARPSRRFVSPLIADGTTTIWWPARAHLATRLATLRMRSGDPIEVPPYLWTMSAMGGGSAVERNRHSPAGEPAILAGAVRLLDRHPAQRHHGLARQAHDARVQPEARHEH